MLILLGKTTTISRFRQLRILMIFRKCIVAKLRIKHIGALLNFQSDNIGMFHRCLSYGIGLARNLHCNASINDQVIDLLTNNINKENMAWHHCGVICFGKKHAYSRISYGNAGWKTLTRREINALSPRQLERVKRALSSTNHFGSHSRSVRHCSLISSLPGRVPGRC